MPTEPYQSSEETNQGCHGCIHQEEIANIANNHIDKEFPIECSMCCRRLPDMYEPVK